MMPSRDGLLFAHALLTRCTCTALQARQLLMSRDGQIATVGARGSRRTSLLDLAIDFNNIEFVACAAARPPRPPCASDIARAASAFLTCPLC